MIDAAIRFVLCVLVFWLPYSTAVIETCVIIALLLWIIKRSIILVHQLKSSPSGLSVPLLLRSFKPVSTPIDKPIAVFLIVTFAAALFNSGWQSSLYAWLTKIVEWFVIFYLFVEVFQTVNQVRAALYVWIVTASATALDAFLQTYVTGRDIFMGHPFSIEGATAGFKHNNSLGAYLAVFVPFIFSFLLVPLDWKKRSGVFALALLSTGGLAISLCRAAWLALGFSSLVVIPVLLKSKIVRIFSVVTAAGLLIGYILFMAGAISLPRTGPNTLSDSANWRVQIWMDSLLMVKERPYLGHGINTYMEKFQNYRRKYWQEGGSSGWATMSPVYAHNCYLQMLVESGIFGLLAFLWLFFSLVQSIVTVILRPGNTGNARGVLVGMLAGIVAFLTHSFFDTHFYSLQISSYFWATTGLAISLARLLKEPGLCDIK